MRLLRARVVPFVVVLAATACTDTALDPTSTMPDSVSAALVRSGSAMLNLSLAPDSLLAPGDTTSITIESRAPTTLRRLGLVLRSTDTAVARVGSRGFVRARAAGSALIIATAGTFADTLPLQVAVARTPQPPTTTAPVPPTAGFGPRSWFAAPAGSTVGSGRLDAPWSLAAALAQPGVVQPGDTIWLRGGTYRGDFVSRLAGTATAPIVVRQYPGERATIDGRLEIGGRNAWFWGFEVMYSDTRRVTSIRGSDPADLPRENKTIFVLGPGVKLINLVVHDMGDGIFAGAPAEGVEVNGCIVYNNGWIGPDRGNGHSIYLQNAGAAKVLRGNVFYNSFSQGIHIYGSDVAQLRNFVIEGNTVFGSGANAEARFNGLGANFLAWGGAPGALGNIVMRGNSLFHTSQTAQAVQMNSPGFAPGFDLTFADNIVQGQPFFAEWRNYVVTGNRFAGAAGFTGGDVLASIRLAPGQAWSAHQWDNNQYATGPAPSTWMFYMVPAGADGIRSDFAGWRSRTGYDRASTLVPAFSGQQVIVRRSDYEPGHAIATVWNWSDAASATIDVGEAVPAGFVAEVRHVYDPYGEPVARIGAGQRTASVSLASRVPPMAIGAPARPRETGTRFNVFVVRRVRA